MRSVRTVLATIALCTTLAASASADPVRPPGQTILPLQSGSLHKFVDLHFNFSRGSAGTVDFNVAQLTLDGAWSFADRFQVGLTLPFVQHGWLNGGLGQAIADTQFGNLAINLKLKLFGLGDFFKLSLYGNTTLPTSSSGSANRDQVLLQIGGAATADLKIITIGGSTGFYGAVGDLNSLLWEWNVYAGTSILPMFELMVALQWNKNFYNSGGGGTAEAGLAIMPYVRFNPILGLHVDLGTRIGVTDFGKIYSYLGRAALMLAVGYDF